jgi:hypothetical protein
MKTLFQTDYIIYDQISKQPHRFTDGNIVIYGYKEDAELDVLRNEIAISCTELPIYFQKELINQIQNDESTRIICWV